MKSREQSRDRSRDFGETKRKDREESHHRSPKNPRILDEAALKPSPLTTDFDTIPDVFLGSNDRWKIGEREMFMTTNLCLQISAVPVK